MTKDNLNNTWLAVSEIVEYFSLMGGSARQGNMQDSDIPLYVACKILKHHKDSFEIDKYLVPDNAVIKAESSMKKRTDAIIRKVKVADVDLFPFLLDFYNHYDLKLKENDKANKWHNIGNYIRERIAIYFNYEDAIVISASLGRLDEIKIMLKNGKDINVQDEDGNTALIEAISEEWFHIALYLINKGADVNKCNNDGDTALDLAKYILIPNDDSSINYSELLLKKLKSKNAQCKNGISAREKKDIEVREIMKEPQRPLILDLLFKDDRMFVLEISRVETRKLTSNEHSKIKWAVITRKNVSSYPPFRTDQFETRNEALAYYKKIVVETPRQSLNNRPPNPIPSIVEYKQWLVGESLFDPILNP